MSNVKNWLAKYPEGTVTHDISIPEISLPQMLQQSVVKYSEHIATSFYGRTTSYKELYHYVVGFASSLQKTGFQKGDRLAIMLPNCPQYVIAYYGTLLAGGIVTQINPMLVERELEYILKDSGSTAIVSFDALYPRVKAVQERTHVETVLTVSLQEEFTPDLPDLTFTHFLQSSDGNFTPIDIDPKHDVAVLQYTGGTTGRSKGAMLTHFNLMANTSQSFEFYQKEFQVGNDKCLTVIPIFHVFGMSVCMNLTLFCGSEIVMLPRFDLQEVLETIKREQPTVFPGVPTMYVAIANHPNAESYGIDSIRVCNSGSAPMPVEVMKAFEQKTGAKITEGYGLSEAAPVTHSNPPFSKRKPGTCGLGYPQTEYKVVDIATGTMECKPGELGELIIRGPQIMKGYWNMPEETENTIRDGWLLTGDIVSVDEEGYLSIVDRKKDMIIAGGFNIYPRDIEEVLYEHPVIQEAVVIGVPDEYRGETVKAFLVFKEGKQATEEELLEYCRANLSAYKVPTFFEIRDELPKTSVGKILRRALRDETVKQS
ncbi:AMP-dependent synthetase [Bacillus coahuilensis p1.1.43]|uniref:AMP-dependent synthetase n=1 Tax=Bacillus coahuilensis p1.1.43 TaxID=1150625 RepID=A0A147KB39_9BACI|nr:long-chain fatty acid--CoA ligase [Bacillus coahuilensis]KUP08101.1 AMP-dependent synthetase [Bacillus coahuilensis p1.1.43]